MGRRHRMGMLSGLLAWTAAAFALCPSPALPRVLEFVEQKVDARLFSASSLAISDDGEHVYVGAYNNSVIFSREEATGELDFAGGMPGADIIAISPNGRNLYIYDYGQLRVFVRDSRTGATTFIEAWSGSTSEIRDFDPRSMTVSPDGRHLYVATFSSLVVFALDPRSGVLSHTETQIDGIDGVTGLYGARHVAVSPDGAHVYVTSGLYIAGRDAVAVFGRDATTGDLSFVDAVFGGSEGVEALHDVSYVLVSPDGRHVYIAARGGVVAFARDGSSGALSFSGVYGDRADALTISPDGMHLYAVSERQAGVAIFARDAGAGTLSLTSVHTGGLDDLGGVDALAITADGRHLYLASSEDRGWAAALARDAGSGALSFVEAHVQDVAGDSDGARNAESMAASPDGRHLYVASGDSSVSALSRSAETGKLELIASYDQTNGVIGLRQAKSLVLSPDGSNVYVASREPALVVLARDATTGELEFLEAHFDGADGVDVHYHPNSLVVSPDGRHLYAASSSGDGGVAVFARDAGTGTLSFLDAYYGGEDGVDGLWGARAVAISPAGEQVYVVSYIDNAVTVFARDSETGELEFLEAYFDGVAGIEGLAGATQDIVVSLDGESVYIAGGLGVAAFRRDAETGRLSFLEVGVEGVHSARALEVTPDGEYVYVFGQELAVYLRDPATGALDLIEAQSFPRYPSFWARSGAQSPDGNFVYAGLNGNKFDAVVVLRRSDGPCGLTPESLCLGDNRFRFEIDWRDHAGNTGSARGVPRGTDESGLLWFFNESNWEMLIKVLDGCRFNNRFWVFAAATTDVEYTLRVTDVLTGATKSYFNPLGTAAAAITDTSAFATCDAQAAATESIEQPADHRAMTWAETDPPLAWLSMPAEPGHVVVTDDLVAPPASVPQKDGGPRYLLTGIGDKCLDVEGSGSADGTPVSLFECHRESNQRWQLVRECDYGGCSEDFEIRGIDGKCLQPVAGATNTSLVVGACGGPEDRWVDRGVFPIQFSLEHVSSGECADVEGGGTDNGTPIILYECHGGDNQLWEYEEIRCIQGPVSRCLNQYRFQVEIEWRDFDGNTGLGRAVRHGTSDSGLFWFFAPGNWETLVKVLDGCDINGHHWVFAAATTNVEYTLRVFDTETGQVREYFNPLGQSASAITDTSAFATCP